MSNENKDFFPWDDIAEGNVFESGIYLFEIAAFDDGVAGTGKRMPKARFKCLEPSNFANMTYFENYVVGTDEDPTNVVAGTMGARSMKQTFKAAQVPKGNSLAEIMTNAVGNQLLLQLNKYEEQAGEYKGTLRNRVIGAFKVGERAVGVAADAAKAGPGAKPPGLSSTPPPPGGKTETVETLICATCGKPIPKAEYSAHVESCTG